MMGRRIIRMVLVGVLCAPGLAVAMPTKSELKSAEPVVQELMAPELKLLKSGGKKQADVAASALELAKQAEGEAAKLLLYRGSLDLFVRAGEGEKAVETLRAIRAEIADVPLEDLASYAEYARKTFRKANPKAPEGVLGRACAEIQARARAEADLKATRRALKKKPADATLQRRLAELQAAQGDWGGALALFAKLGAKEAKAVEDETERADLPAAADFWYDYAPSASFTAAAFRGHAAELYRRCLDENLLKGLLRTRAERRAEETEKAAVPSFFDSGAESAGSLYMVVDISGGAVAKTCSISYLKDIPKGGWTDEYKTSKLVLRRIEPGTFQMGDPTRRMKDAQPVEVTLTKPFYIGIFELTQRQWELVMGNRPSLWAGRHYATRPVENVSYEDIRGKEKGAQWPALDEVDATSFLGVLRRRTGLVFDLPTEAQWEFACRAGTTEQLNAPGNLAELARYRSNGGWNKNWGNYSWKSYLEHMDRACLPENGTAAVGSYRPNAWGLYDCHGNVWEWCRDWKGTYQGGRDPVGVTSSPVRVFRGGGWNDDPADNPRTGIFGSAVRSGDRWGYPRETGDNRGFRIFCSAR